MRITTLLRSIWLNSLYRNSFWLTAGSFLMSGTGFIYWLIASKSYTPAEIGLAATFFSTAALINTIAMLGLNTALVRYLPDSKQKSVDINTVFAVVILFSFVIGALFISGIHIWANDLWFLKATGIATIFSLLFFPLNTTNAITDAVFTSHRESKFVFTSNLVQSVSRVVSLIALSALGIWGILISNAIGVAAAVIFCIVLISVRYGVFFSFKINSSVVVKFKRFAFGNYLSSLVGTIPALLLPLIITNRVSPEQTAFYYMPSMITSFLSILPSTISRSYFAESSYGGKPLPIFKPILMTFSVILPLTVLVLIFGSNFLSLFGRDYSESGYNYLVLSCLAVLISVFNYFLGTKLLIQHKLRKMLMVTTAGAIVYLVGSWQFSSLGIVGVGIASILSQLISIFLLLIL